MSLEDPLVRRYLDQFRSALEALPLSEEERPEILLEIESHIAEARQSGLPLARVLENLGPADQLAEAYGMELLLRPKPVRPAVLWISRIVTALTTLVLGTVLGALGLGLLLGGLLGALFAIVGPFLPATWLDPTLRLGLPQIVVLLVSLVLMGVGFLSLRILRFNLRLLIARINKAFTR